MRRTRHLGLLLVVVTFVATAQLAATQAETLVGSITRGTVARHVVAHDQSAVVPLPDLARARRASANPVPAAFAFASAVAVLAAGWLVSVRRRRGPVSRPLIAFRRRGPPFLPVVT